MVDKSKAKSHKLWAQNNKPMNGVLTVPKEFYDNLMDFYNTKSEDSKKFGEIKTGANGSVNNYSLFIITYNSSV